MRKLFTWRNFIASLVAGVVGGAFFGLLRWWGEGEYPWIAALFFAVFFGLASFFILNPMSEKEKAKRKAKEDQSAK